MFPKIRFVSRTDCSEFWIDWLIDWLIDRSIVPVFKYLGSSHFVGWVDGWLPMIESPKMMMQTRRPSFFSDTLVICILKFTYWSIVSLRFQSQFDIWHEHHRFTCYSMYVSLYYRLVFPVCISDGTVLALSNTVQWMGDPWSIITCTWLYW